MNQQWHDYERLRDLALEDRATADEIAQLERYVLQSTDMKKDYAEHAYLVAFASSIPAIDDDAFATGDAPTMPSGSNSFRNPRLFVLAAGILVALVGSWYLLGVKQTDSFAQLNWNNECQWGESSLNTTAGGMLGPGRLRLLSGIATVQFPLVDVSLEGPVDFEIVGESRCRVHSGRVLASVRKGGEGFVLETPTATLIDRGTVFGVNVRPAVASDVQVLSGKVDVDHHLTGKRTTVQQHQRLRITDQTVGLIDEPAESALGGALQDTVPMRSIQISTAIGRGDDAYVSAKELPKLSSSTTALLVKRPPNTLPGQFGYPWQRKAFLRFDLSLIGDAKIEQATLQLQGVATNIGFASLMPDATFFVYGLTDDQQDDWDPSEMKWGTSPAQLGIEAAPNPSAVTLLGTFTVPQSQPTGQFELSTEQLASFLRDDANRQATLIIISETAGQGAAYCHGFASRRHPNFPAPTLRLTVKSPVQTANYLESKGD